MSQALIALVAIVLDEADKFAADEQLPEAMKEPMQKHALRLKSLYHAACEEASQVQVPSLCSRCGRVPVGYGRVCNNCAAAGN